MKKISVYLFFAMCVGFNLACADIALGASTEGKKGLMVLGAEAPSFGLPDVVTQRIVSLEDFSGKKAVLVVFVCRHCPFVQHIKKDLVELAKDYASKDIAIVMISSNDPEAYPDDSPGKLKEMAVEDGFSMPLLYDETQEVAKAYTAVATPDFFLFDKDRKLVYRGQFDDSRPGNNIPVTGRDVRRAIDAVLDGKPASSAQKPAIGCSIKWKTGNEPYYL